LKAYYCITVTVTEALVLRPLWPRAHLRVNQYPGARRQNETEMFSDHDETSPSIAVVSALSVACFMLAPIRRRVRRWSAQRRSTWNIGNRCQKVCDIFRRVSQKRLVNQQAQRVLDPLSDWQPVQLTKSWSHTVLNCVLNWCSILQWR